MVVAMRSAAALPLLRWLGRASVAPLRWYHRKLGELPLLVKTTTSGAILASADLLSQWLSRGDGAACSTSGSASPAAAALAHEVPRLAGWWSPRQTALVGLYGALFIAPFTHFWHQFLELRVPIPPMSTMATKLRRVTQRVALDQVVVSPVLTTGLFISRGLIARSLSYFFSLGSEWALLNALAIHYLWCGAAIWPTAQMFNFFFVPLPYRVLFINMVGFGFSTYTSLVASKAFWSAQPGISVSPSRRGLAPEILPGYLWAHPQPCASASTPPKASTVGSCKG